MKCFVENNMWTILCTLVLLSAACSGNPISKPLNRDAEDDIEFAKYSTKKVSYDLDVLEARTNILALELQFTVLDLVLDIEKLLDELLFPADAERVIAEINKTAQSVLTNVVRLSDIIVRLDSTIIVVDNDLQFDVASIKNDLPLLESYITNFNLTYDIGNENIILATNLIILTLQNELEDINEPEVAIVFNLAEKIKVVLLAEQGYLDNARLSFDRNAFLLLEALKVVVEGNKTITKNDRLDTKTTTPIRLPTTPPTTTMSFVPTTPSTSTMSIIPVTTTTPTLITDRTPTSTPFFTSDRTTTSTPFFTSDRTTTETSTITTDTTRTLHTVTTPTPTAPIYSN